MTTDKSDQRRELWIYLRFPLLAIEALVTAANDQSRNQPVAVVSTQGNPRRILYSNNHAQAWGVEPGLSAPTALALCPGLKTLERQTDREQKLLERLALLSYQFTPTVILAPPHGLWLEVAGSQNLFGGYRKLLKKLREDLTTETVSTQAGIGQSAIAARVLCADTLPEQVPDNAKLQQQLSATSLDQLDISEQQQRRFLQLGFRTIGDLLALPRHTLGKRFGHSLLAQLQLLTGERPCTLPCFHPPEYFEDDLQHPDGIVSKQGLLFPMKVLLQRLCRYLVARQRHCLNIQWRFEPLLGEGRTMAVQLTSSQNNWGSLLTLSRLQLERLSLPHSVERITLHSRHFIAAPLNSLDLFGDREQSSRKELIDKLIAKLGIQSLTQPSVNERFLPEQAGNFLSPAEAPSSKLESPTTPSAPHPLWLLPAPAPAIVRGKQLFWREPLKLLRGPERLCGDWWQRGQQRDYYVAESLNGSRYWLFRDADSKRWFIHGIFA